MSEIQDTQAQNNGEAGSISANLENVKFNFKARSIRNEAGDVIGKGKKQPPVIVPLPKPTAEQLIAILNLPDEEVPEEKNAKGEVVKPASTRYPKIKQFVLDAIFDPVKAQAKAQLDEAIEGFGEDETKQVSASLIDFDKLDLSYIANLEPGQRGLSAIPEEDYQNFYQDYTQVMVKATGKELDRIQKHIALFEKPTKIRQNKDAQKLLIDQLDIYRSTSTAYANEDTLQVADRIYNKFKKWFEEDDKAVVDAL